MSFQARATAWFGVRILAEKEAASLYDLPTEVTFDALRCETSADVDDLFLATSQGGTVFVQAKRGVGLSATEDSPLASALGQFVRQFLAGRPHQLGVKGGEALSPKADRLVLFVGATAPATIHRDTRAALNRLRHLPEGAELLDAGTNKAERHALETVMAHVKRHWKRLLGADPTESELRDLLSLCYIDHRLVEEGERDEVAARDMLIRCVLAVPEQVDLAWSLLTQQAAGFAKNRSGADRVSLRNNLGSAGIELRAPASYRQDIERLGSWTARFHEDLAEFASVHAPERSITLPRNSNAAVRSAASDGPLLVVGEPGAGKSGCIHALVASLQEADEDVVLLPVDHLASASQGELRRELDLAHELDEVLLNWVGQRPGYLVLDALDASRSDRVAGVVRELIRRLISSNSRWRVVASIRKFDLRYSRELARLFPGSGHPGFADAEFPNVSHVNVPLLSDDELDAIAAQSERIAGLLQKAGDELRTLLRVPFNIRLVGDLLRTGATADSLSTVETQLELLDAYWHARVLGTDGRSDARESVLSTLCDEIAANRSLYGYRSRIASSPGATDELLSAGVLSEWTPPSKPRPDRARLAFAHHILFDYSFARLKLRVDAADLTAMFRDDPDLGLVARPSLVLHAQHLWTDDREEFWSVTDALLAETPSSVAALVWPISVAQLAFDLEDLRPLYQRGSPPQESRLPRLATLQHVISALSAAATRIVGTEHQPWAALCLELSRQLSPEVLGLVRVMLARLVPQLDIATIQQVDAIAEVGERVLEHVWDNEPGDRISAPWGIRAICRTLHRGREDSRRLLSRCVSPEHLAARGFLDLPWVAREIESVVDAAPSLAKEVYAAAFSYQDESETSTPLGASQLLQLRSTRKQDYAQGLWELSRHYRHFLKSSPRTAIETLVELFRSGPPGRDYSGDSASSDVHAGSLRFRFVPDGSYSWDLGFAGLDKDAVGMLDAFESDVRARCTDDAALAHAVFETVARNDAPAVFWRRLLRAGTDSADHLVPFVLELCAEPAVLYALETRQPAGEFLRSRFSAASASIRAAVEEAILALPERFDDTDGWATRARDTLIGCLAPSAIVGEGTKTLLRDLQKREAVPVNRPPISFEPMTSSGIERSEHFEMLGIRVDAYAEEMLEAISLCERLARDEAADEDAVIGAVNDLRRRSAEDDGDESHDPVRDQGWDHLAGHCSQLAQRPSFSCQGRLGSLVRNCLLLATAGRHPVPDPDRDERFAAGPSWGSPSARIDAAAGLLFLCQQPACANDAVLEAIDRLSGDVAAAVRFQVAVYLRALGAANEAAMWRIAERLAREERNDAVTGALVNQTIPHLLRLDVERGFDLLREAMEQLSQQDSADQIRFSAWALIQQLDLFHRHPRSTEMVEAVATEPQAAVDVAGHLATALRPVLTHGGDNANDSEIRRRAIGRLHSILTRASHAFHHASAEASGGETPVESVDTNASGLARLIVTICDEVYFGSGAFQPQSGGGRVSREASRRFYREAGALLDALAEVAFVPGAHHVIGTLETFIDYDPAPVFLRIATAVATSSAAGYQYESLAADTIVRIVQRYLADYRGLLREREDCRSALRDLLRVFVDAGWPSAHQLTYRLGEIYR